MSLTKVTYSMIKGAEQGIYDYLGDTVSTNTTVDDTIFLQGQADYPVTINNGITLTINGSFDAGLYQVFDCVGTGKVVFAAGQQVKPEWFGTNGTTDSAAIQKAVDSITTVRGGTVVFEPSTKYAIDTTITIDPTSGPINLVSDMGWPEGQVGGYLWPTQNLTNGMIRYTSATRAPRGSNISGLAFYDPNFDKLIGGALVLDDWSGRCSDCNFAYLRGPAVATDNVIMSGFYNLKIRLCGQNASGKYALELGKAGSSEVTQSVVVDNLISEVNYYGPYTTINDTAYDVKITNAQFEADTAVADTNKAFIFDNGTRTIVSNCGFNRNNYTSVVSYKGTTLTNCIFESDTQNQNPKIWIYGQGAVLDNLKLIGGYTNPDYDLILGNPASPAAVYATVSNIYTVYGSAIWDGGQSVFSNINMLYTFELTSPPTGNYAFYLGMGAPSKLANYNSFNIHAGNVALYDVNPLNQTVNVP